MGQKGLQQFKPGEQFEASLMISVRQCHPNTPQEKGPLLIRPLVLKLPIDFHCGRLWGSDLLQFLASTKAKLSHLEARSAFRDSGSAQTPLANLFPSGVIFLRSYRIPTQRIGH